MKIYPRYPFPKSFPSGKGLAITSFKGPNLDLVDYMVVSLLLWLEVVGELYTPFVKD